MSRYSIRQYVAWLTLTPLLVITVSLESFFLHDHFVDLDRNLKERGMLIANQLASSSEYGVFSNNRPFLQKIAQDALKQPDVQGVLILDAAAGVLIEAGEFFGVSKNTAGTAGSEAGDDMHAQSARVGKITGTVNLQMPVYRSRGSVRIYRPISPAQVMLDEQDAGYQAAQIGTVVVEMSNARTAQLKSRMLWLTVGATVLFLIFPFGLIYLGSRKITVPIRQLSEAVQAMGGLGRALSHPRR